MSEKPNITFEAVRNAAMSAAVLLGSASCAVNDSREWTPASDTLSTQVTEEYPGANDIRVKDDEGESPIVRWEYDDKGDDKGVLKCEAATNTGTGETADTASATQLSSNAECKEPEDNDDDQIFIYLMPFYIVAAIFVVSSGSKR